MKVEIFPGFWTLEDVRNSKGKIFIYGDNDARFGKGGQSIIRDEPNTIGIRTKKLPYSDDNSYYNDLEFEENKNKIIEDIDNILLQSLLGKIIVFSNGGYGTDRAKLQEKAPKTFQFLCDILLDKFNYNNQIIN